MGIHSVEKQQLSAKEMWHCQITALGVPGEKVMTKLSPKRGLIAISREPKIVNNPENRQILTL